MKKITSVLLTVVMLFSVLCMPTQAAELTDYVNPVISVDEEAGKLTVTLQAVQTTTNGKFTVDYNPALITYNAEESAYKGTLLDVAVNNGVVKVSFASATADAIVAGETIATVVFDVVGTFSHAIITVAFLEINGQETFAKSYQTVLLSESASTPDPEPEDPKPEDPAPAPTPDEEVTTNPDGSTTTTVTDKDGTVTETTETKDGSTATVVTDAKGEVTEVKAEISKEAVKAETVTVPVEVEAAEDANEAVAVEITMPKVEEPVAVEIPVAEVTSGTVVILVHEDGTEEVVAATAMSENGVVIEVTGSVTVKVVDNSKDFVDDEMWAKDAINFVTARKIFNGTSENTFSPDQAMTRAMLMAVLARLDGADASGADWAEKAMAWAKANGISDGTNPDGNVTREQMVTMLYRFAGEPATNGSLAAFTDASSVSAYAVDAMKWAVENGIIGGMGDGTLAPQGTATRAQLAKILMYFINL